MFHPVLHFVPLGIIEAIQSSNQISGNTTESFELFWLVPKTLKTCPVSAINELSFTDLSVLFLLVLFNLHPNIIQGEIVVIDNFNVSQINQVITSHVTTTLFMFFMNEFPFSAS